MQGFWGVRRGRREIPGRLFKFYRPNTYKEAPKKELTEEEKLLVASGAGDMVATAAPEMIAGTSIAAMQTSVPSIAESSNFWDRDMHSADNKR